MYGSSPSHRLRNLKELWLIPWVTSVWTFMSQFTMVCSGSPYGKSVYFMYMYSTVMKHRACPCSIHDELQEPYGFLKGKVHAHHRYLVAFNPLVFKEINQTWESCITTGTRVLEKMAKSYVFYFIVSEKVWSIQHNNSNVDISDNSFSDWLILVPTLHQISF